ncbi:MAG: glycosyltransferase [Chloroflexi bacterium]|nr:glycosyltransferase [Chloroflexota bacterium]
MDLSIIIVNWNVKDLLRRCLESIPAGAAGLSYEIIVVDNASTDGSPALQETFPHVRWIQNRENVGFTRANNQGLRVAQGRYICFLNPDTYVHPQSLTTLVRYLEDHPRVGIVGPQLRYPDGTLQPSRYRFPTLWTALWESTPLEWAWPNNPWTRRYHCADCPRDREHPVDWLNGACLVVRKEVIDQVGPFDEGFFMYSEELDLCRRAKEAGWEVVYLPDAVVTHYEGRSSGQVHLLRDLHFHRSKVRYFRKHHGPWAAHILRWGLRLEYAGQLLLEGAKWLVGHKRPLRAQRIRVYWAVMRQALK